MKVEVKNIQVNVYMIVLMDIKTIIFGEKKVIILKKELLKM